MPKNTEIKNTPLAVSTIDGPAGRFAAQDRLSPIQAHIPPISAASSRIDGKVFAQQRAATAGRQVFRGHGDGIGHRAAKAEAG